MCKPKVNNQPSVVASFQVPGTTPLEKLPLKMDVGRARNAFASHSAYGCVELTDGKGRVAGFGFTR